MQDHCRDGFHFSAWHAVQSVPFRLSQSGRIAIICHEHYCLCLTAIPEVLSKPRILGGKFDNAIPEPVVTESPKLRLQPFDYDGDVYIGPGQEVTPPIPTGEDEDEEEGNGVDGERLNPRGDVFCEFISVSHTHTHTQLLVSEAGPTQREPDKKTS